MTEMLLILFLNRDIITTILMSVIFIVRVTKSLNFMLNFQKVPMSLWLVSHSCLQLSLDHPYCHFHRILVLPRWAISNVCNMPSKTCRNGKMRNQGTKQALHPAVIDVIPEDQGFTWGQSLLSLERCS